MAASQALFSRPSGRSLRPPNWLICEDCDTVYLRPDLQAGEAAFCARCGAVLERHVRFGLDALAALVLTALIVFLMGNMWPVATLSLNGQEISATLWDMILIMWRDHSRIVGAITAITLFYFPLINLMGIGWLLLFARQGRRAPGFRPLMVAMHHLGPWTMSEVFVLGALVAMVKAKSYFDVMPDPGIYAYAVLTVLITIFAGIDLRRLWDHVPDHSP
ncbi:MAG: paraquat-inducible protein A [Steroidobacteraceae bacterium]|jgi:paraquat-inducible protein A